jgi:hypothetical protein
VLGFAAAVAVRAVSACRKEALTMGWSQALLLVLVLVLLLDFIVLMCVVGKTIRCSV